MAIRRADIACSSSSGIATESAVMPSTDCMGAEHNGIPRFARTQRNQNHRELPHLRFESGFVAHFPHDRVCAAQQFHPAVRDRARENALVFERLARRDARDHAIHAGGAVDQFRGFVLQSR